ncbi:hypothetical protein F3Y22_tig00111842pilonHSYRG00069 [Hibiscus syriacus]|uniref:Reverse transcriptase domain-containing protein n=1 Tax=Hibiscus syriacus TaxID=106335 RepID=A0A6A2YE82_HIBSY|nr:hypothetical protein F3Y22_tig00111842pilonHSYRG00069 [Hibiscus syriacus]
MFPLLGGHIFSNLSKSDGSKTLSFPDSSFFYGEEREKVVPLLKLGSVFSAWNLFSSESRESGGFERHSLSLKLGLKFSLLRNGEKRKLSASRLDMSSGELRISGREGKGLGSDQSDLDSLKLDPRVKGGGGVGGGFRMGFEKLLKSWKMTLKEEKRFSNSWGETERILPENLGSFSGHVFMFLIASAIDDCLRSCPSFRSHRAYKGRALQSGVKETRLRVCSLNVGTLNARLLELTDVLSNRKIDFACIQETRWKGARVRECNGYKLWYHAYITLEMGWILVSYRLKENVVEVCRYRDRIMMIKVIIEAEVVNVLSVYAPHIDLEEGEKRCFWDQLDDVLRSIPEDQRVFIGGDFNGHIGSATDGLYAMGGALIGGLNLVNLGSFGRTYMERQLMTLGVRKVGKKPLDYRQGRSRRIKNRGGGTTKFKIRYTEEKREAKKTVAKAKDKVYEEMYKRLDTKEGQKDIFRLAKSRENRKNDLGSIRFIKDNNGVLLVKDHDIKRVWGSYFFGLFNDGASPCRDSTVGGSAIFHTTANDCLTSRIGFEEVKMVLRKMGRDKAVGPDQIPITVWLALGEEGVKWLTNIFNIILETAKMPEEWRESTVIPIYKNKGDPNIVATTEAYDSVPRDTVWKTLETRRIPTAYIRAIRDMYCRSTTYVRTTVGDIEVFPVEIELLQGSALRPYIFALIMDDIYCATPDGVLWCMLFTDDIVLVAETKTELNSRLATWKTALEEKGLGINIEKTEYLCSNFSGNQNDEDMRGVDDDITHRIKAGWLKWMAATGVLCDKKVPLKLKGKFYRMAIRPALLYGSECWAIKKDHVKMMEAAEMRMLRWACGRTLWNMTPNSAIRMSLGVVLVSEKLREGRLRWFGHVLRQQPSDAVRRVESITVDGARRRGRPRRKWEDCLRSDLKDLALTEDMTSDRKIWRLKTRVAE